MKRKLFVLTLGLFLVSNILFAGVSNTYSLVIGINEFPNITEYGNLFAVNDANKVYELFKDTHHRSVLLTNEKATRENIFSSLISILEQMNTNDKLIIYVSTFSVIENNDLYFLTSDTKKENIIGTGISSKDLLNICYEKSTDNNILFVLDCSYSAAIIYNLSPNYVGKGFSFILSSADYETSAESNSYNHGLFTYYFLQSFSKNLYSKNKQSLTIRDVYDYVYNKFQQSQIRSQNPVFWGKDFEIFRFSDNNNKR